MRTLSRNFPFFAFKVETTFKGKGVRRLLVQIREIVREYFENLMTFTRTLVDLHVCTYVTYVRCSVK